MAVIGKLDLVPRRNSAGVRPNFHRF